MHELVARSSGPGGCRRSFPARSAASATVRGSCAELRGAGLDVADLVSVEGPAFLLADLAERLDEEAARAVVLDTARAVERAPELLGLGPHLLATGVAPLAGLERLMLRMPGPRGFRGRASAPCERAQLELADEVMVLALL
jgi:hypothetical protein